MPARSDTAPFGQLSIRRGPVPDALPGGVQVDPITQAAPGLLLLKHPSAGGFIVRNGREILVQPAGADLGDLCPYVLSSGFAAICIQRGLLLLHASAVAIGSGAVAFTGPKGAGKSTLLGAFVGAGHAALADDMSLIETRSDQTAHLWAVPGYLRLWPDSVQALGLEDRPASPELSGSAKLQLSLDITAVDGAKPLSAIFMLTAGESAVALIEPIETAAAIAGLAGQLFRPHYIHPLGQIASLIPQIGKPLPARRYSGSVAARSTITCRPRSTRFDGRLTRRNDNRAIS
jgi:energy-coupling factor transporter ATP-binding protein EcfA2